jgi:16S rRNA processing protein RimM
MSGRLVALGVFGAPHGVRGEVRLKSFTAEPMAIAGFRPLLAVDGRRFDIAAARPLKDDMLVVKVDGVADRDAAARLTNLTLHVPREALGQAGEEDEFFHADLVGLAAETADGEALGRVVALLDFGAGDLIEIAPAGGGPSRLYPFTKAVVPLVDLAGGRLVLVPPIETEAGPQDDPRRTHRKTVTAPEEDRPKGVRRGR